MAYPRVIPHSDGAGTIDMVGPGVSSGRLGQRVWCYGAQSYRPFGTVADYVVVPEILAVPLETLPKRSWTKASAATLRPGSRSRRSPTHMSLLKQGHRVASSSRSLSGDAWKGGAIAYWNL
jgi:NADPH:quinone reductase-like Zn-dependent oxidoreductase